MSRLDQLGLVDVRNRFMRTPRAIGKRPGRAIGGTLHYAGEKAVPARLIVDRRADGATAIKAQREQLIRFIQDAYVPRHIHELGADGLQYHLLVTASGEILQARTIDDQLWHCANAIGNKWSIAVHLPLGGSQDVTPIQWQRTIDVFEAIISDFAGGSRSAIRGHCEWPRTDGIPQKICPGPILMPRLVGWRSATGPRFYRVTADANIRQAPTRQSPVALNGMAIVRVGTPEATFLVDEITTGERIGTENRWAHRADGLGFVHMSLLVAA